MEDGKVERVKNWETPTTVRGIRKFLGFTGYYQHFIQDYSKIACPLLALTHKDTPWSWSSEQQTAFETLRDKMCMCPVLRQPDFKKTFYVHTDTSALGLGAILSQEGEINPKMGKP